MSERVFYKSTYSESGACLEVSLPVERAFIKSSYSGPTGGQCFEASAPDGFRFKNAVRPCGNIACNEVTLSESITFAASKYSAQGNCLEIGGEGSKVLMRDSKISQSPVVGVAPESFNTFIDAVVEENFVPISA